MVSFFDGGTASSDDARALARRLAGGEPFTEARELRADLDRDGTVTAADLLLLLRAAHGDLTTPPPVPRIELLSPLAVRPGAPVHVRGANLGTDPAVLRLALTRDRTVNIVEAESIIDGGVSFRVPPAITPRGGIFRARVLRDGVMSDATVVWIGDAVVHSIEIAPGFDEHRVIIHGSGFTAPASVSAGQVLLTPTSVTPDALEVDMSSVNAASEVVVYVGDVATNPTTYVPRAPWTGTVYVPAGVAIAPSSLSVWCGGSTSVPVAADGTFALSAPASRLVMFEVAAGGGTLLGAATLSAASVVIDLASTAVWAVVTMIAPPVDDADAIATWLDTLRTQPEVAAFAALLGPALAAHGAVFAAIRQDAPLRDALRIAVNVAGARFRALYQGTAS